MTTASSDQGAKSASDNFQLALATVRKHWVPIDAGYAANLAEKIISGDFDHDRPALLRALQSDVALYVTLLRKLTENGSGPQLAETPESMDPATLIGKSSPKLLHDALASISEEQSTHSLDRMNDIQAARFQESVISASTARVMARSTNLDPEMGYTTGVLRQLGLTALAWNYSRVYKNALKKVTTSNSLNMVLAKMLGFPPHDLNQALAQSWGLAPELYMALGTSKELSSQKDDLGKVARRLAYACQTGEALARANNPQLYPTAEADWEHASREIEARVGQVGMRMIQSSITESYKHYSRYSTELFSADAEKRISPILPREFNWQEAYEGNRYLKQCGSGLQEIMYNLYSKMSSDGVSKHSIEMLTTEIIPQAGFFRGCVYVHDRDNSQLIPRVAVGNVPLTIYETIDCSPLAPSEGPVIQAFLSHELFRGESVQQHGSTYTCLASVFGYIQRAGVLYLEVSPDFNKFHYVEPEIVFRAINRALMDCLKLH